jgi:hypothetical protein
MIDNFALAISHGLILLAAWRLVRRPDLDDDNAPVPTSTMKPKSRLPSFLKGGRGA